MDKKIGIGIAVLIVVVIGVVVLLPKGSTKYDGVAQCLTEKGVKFYGAFWCPHCQNQKKMFGRSARLLPYVECSTPDGKEMIPSCAEKGVRSYPTWMLSDGEVLEGEILPETLAEKTGCPLPS